jgi:hypothetical protein
MWYILLLAFVKTHLAGCLSFPDLLFFIVSTRSFDKDKPIIEIDKKDLPRE